MSDAAIGNSPTATTNMTAASRRTMILSVALVVASVTALFGAGLLEHSPPNSLLSWWSIALIAIAAEFMVFDVEFRREVYSFTFSEMPLVLGLFLASPRDLVIGRLVGELLFLVVRERQPPRKLALNLAAFLGETTMLLAAHDLLGGSLMVTDPLEWIRALGATTAAVVVGYLVVFKVVRWHGAPITLSSILVIGGLTIPVNTSFALVIGILLVESPWATLLLAGVGGFLVIAYRSYTSLRQRHESLTLLYDFTRLVSGAQRPDAVLEAMLGQAKDLLRAERAEIWLRGDDDAMLRLRVDDEGRSTKDLAVDAPLVMATWFARHSDSRVLSDTETDAVGRSLLKHLGAHDGIVAPITESGEIVGLVAVVNRLGEVNRFQESDRTMFATLANHASVALENGRLIDRLHDEARLREHEALHDALTGLPNRVMLGDRLRDDLASVAEKDRTVAIGLMDLDGFKEVNDTLGHQAGDTVLVEVARRLAYAAETATMVARLGGDEFAILVADDTSRKALETLARRIRDELSRPLTVDGMRINVSASIGFALAPADATVAATLIQRADVAMYSAKAGTGNGVAFYDAIRDENSPRRLALANELRAAIAHGELSLVFQPKARLTDNVVIGFEALVRWRHPEFGQVFPDEFIPIAERTGSINELTVFVLNRSVDEAAAWARAGHCWSVAVNVAMRNLLDEDFAMIVQTALERSGCEPELLTLEITETNVMTDTARTVDVMQRLAALGVRLSVDDFGTGYSSLSYLQQLPVVELKIDQCFVRDMVRDPSADAIVRSVLDLANNLELSVVAEGVEDRETWDRLRRLGCTQAQGYHLARPMPPADIEPWFATHLGEAAVSVGRSTNHSTVRPSGSTGRSDDAEQPVSIGARRGNR